MKIALKDYIKEERVFLHDLSNYLVIAQGMQEVALNKLKPGSTIEEKDLERFKKSENAINKLIDLLRARRTVVKNTEANVED